MKARRGKQLLAWVIGLTIAIGVPGALIARGELKSMGAKVGRGKVLIAGIVTEYYGGKSVDKDILKESTTQVHKILDETKVKKGNLISLGMADTIPSIEDLKARGEELSYNLPAQFEKGDVTFTFRVRNQEPPIVTWIEVSDGILPHDDFKKRLQQHLP